jgi:hypothetical protein
LKKLSSRSAPTPDGLAYLSQINPEDFSHVPSEEVSSNKTTCDAVNGLIKHQTSSSHCPSETMHFTTAWILAIAASYSSNAMAATLLIQGQPSDTYCTQFFVPYLLPNFEIVLVGWGQEPDGCGKGFLDNLQPCGNIENWNCDKVGQANAIVTFSIDLGAQDDQCIRNAIYLASPSDNRAVGVSCREFESG